ncbi:DNA-3-methyladenine glycosylase family protein [Bacillus sp. 2205SS5-2]|uniref:DNA-3-methyladenine glycosylase family protein n=1 Tax=Bacillus sp. 2205SS5-2 TaxID=3109031 RepID=UPI0030070DFC
MNWTKHNDTFQIPTPTDFNFQECLVFLKRSNQEILHRVGEQFVEKLLYIQNNMILLHISWTPKSLILRFPLGCPSFDEQKQVVKYVCEWFDLSRNLDEFYLMASRDPLLAPIAESYRGLRVIGFPDLFEAITWAITGQQINLTFAYTLRKRFIEHYGESISVGNQTYWLYPNPRKISFLSIDELRSLQFTGRKAEYIIGVAKAMMNEQISKASLLQENKQEAIASLTALRGIGEWSAHYVLMKCLGDMSAFPVTDVGLQNAIKDQLGLERKPTINEIHSLAADWEGWQTYATFYLWRTLYD